MARLKDVAKAEQLHVEDDALHLIAKSANGGMRDALSLLDQVLSFGEGPVTAARVREVLGLIPDELYGEMLRAIVERDPGAIFPLIDRLLPGPRYEWSRPVARAPKPRKGDPDETPRPRGRVVPGHVVPGHGALADTRS